MAGILNVFPRVSTGFARMACTAGGTPSPMENQQNLTGIVSAMLSDLLKFYDERIPERSDFPDVRVGRPYTFGDPSISLPGRVEFVLMNMDARLDPTYEYLRFLSVRVMKSREGGYSSSTCLHGRKDELKARLAELLENSEFLEARILELAEGLPEETNPDIWR